MPSSSFWRLSKGFEVISASALRAVSSCGWTDLRIRLPSLLRSFASEYGLFLVGETSIGSNLGWSDARGLVSALMPT